MTNPRKTQPARCLFPFSTQDSCVADEYPVGRAVADGTIRQCLPREAEQVAEDQLAVCRGVDLAVAVYIEAASSKEMFLRRLRRCPLGAAHHNEQQANQRGDRPREAVAVLCN